MYYKLIDVIDVPMTLNVARKVNGYTKYGHIRLLPDTKYEIPTEEGLLDSLKEATTKVRWSQELENALKACGAQYSVQMCPSCGGRVKKIEYHVVEVVE